MFSRASSKLGIRSFSTARSQNIPKSRATHWAVASTTLAGVSLYVLFQKPVYNDAPTGQSLSPLKQKLENVGLSPLVWGSNLNHLISPERDTKDYIKSPTPMPELFSSPLRDLTFGTRHAACVDAAGNVYQWGDAFFADDPNENRQSRLTLQGKNIISLAVTPCKTFALSVSGDIYVLSSFLKRQAARPRAQSWWSIFNNSEPQLAVFEVLKTDVSLFSGERFTSISAGSDHLLALTSHGRTFAHPVTRLANCYGQLGLRKISIADPADPSKRIPFDLTPKMTRDTGVGPTMPNPDLYKSDVELPNAAFEKVGFCDSLFEVPALRGVDVKQAVAGDRTSFVVTSRDGRVLGWGANEFGQLGLGANITLPRVAVPTEILLNKFNDRGTRNHCIDVAAGGDLTFFTVERDLPTSGSRVVDVLACGNGQWGGLGNASYSNAQGTPVRVKNISGVLEYDEVTESLEPLKPHEISVAPGPPTKDTMMPSSSGHVIATLDTIPLSHTSSETSPGRDVLSWGLNQQYQVGNGKRGSVAAPVPVQTGDSDDDGGRLMCRIKREKVTDFNGKIVGRNMVIEQRAVAGPGISVVYWRIV